MKKVFTLFAILPLILAAAPAFAQIYEADPAQQGEELDCYVAPPIALGFRANPDGAGLNGRYYFSENLAIEGQVNGSAGNYYDNGTSFTMGALLEYHFILRDPHWRVFIGGGAHYGRWSRYREIHLKPINLFGLDAIGGVEYILQSAPIGISLDIKPALNFIDGVTYLPNNVFGLSVRYYFGGGSKKTKDIIITEDHAAQAPLPSDPLTDMKEKD
jgi:hypothetical protein